ncbi:MAG: oligopeptide transport system permease protein [Acidobacteriota bacterium]|jgi:oligopeptide transport system permease protein|nr:oligopeptide transport system permease protein [Acidobacteriota bacterium]
MSEEREPKVPTEEGRPPRDLWSEGEPALTPEGTPPSPPVKARRGDEIHAFPEMAVGEGDVRTAGEVPEVTRGTSLWKDAWRRLLKNRLAVFGLFVVCFIILAVLLGPPVIKATTGFQYDTIPADTKLVQSFPPFTGPDGQFAATHPMGTDSAGRDMLARVLQGGRISLMVGIISTFVSLLIGITWGATAGYLGGKIDDVLMRIVDVLYAIPYMMIVIVLLAFFGGRSPLQQIFLLFAALGAVSWLTMARIVRGQVISLKNQEFVLAARATGVSTPKIIFRHLVPNALGPVIVYATLTIPSVMLTEAFLSFLGLGVQAPYASWGSLAQEGIQNIAVFPWQLIFPGVTMALTLFSLNFLGDGLRDALDPQMRKF